MKLLQNHFSSQPSDIFNISFSTGVFTSILKIAKIVLVHKKDSKLCLSSFRSISLLSNIKIFLGRVIYNRIHKSFNDNNLIFPLQFRFRQKHSNNHTFISLTETIRKNTDKANIGCGNLGDLQEAFDTVEHYFLWSRLEHHDICGLANDWFKSYLSYRKQYVSINDYDSNLAAVKFGAPQGSVFCLILFEIYVNDLKQAFKICKSITLLLMTQTYFILINQAIDLINKSTSIWNILVTGYILTKFLWMWKKSELNILTSKLMKV